MTSKFLFAERKEQDEKLKKALEKEKQMEAKMEVAS